MREHSDTSSACSGRGFAPQVFICLVDSYVVSRQSRDVRCVRADVTQAHAELAHTSLEVAKLQVPYLLLLPLRHIHCM